MKTINFGVKLKTVSGVETSVALKDVATNALTFTYKDEAGLNPEIKVKRWNLAKKIAVAVKPVSLEVEEIILVKSMLNKAYGTQVYGQTADAFKAFDVQDV